MGKIIAKKVRGMNMWAKGTLIVTVTLLVSMFMYQGWYKPKPAQAAIANAKAWTQLYAGTAFPTSYTFDSTTTTPGTNRVMVVSVSSTRTTSGAQTTATATYGGQNMTLAVGDAGSTSVAHSYLFYLDEAGIAAAEAVSNKTLAVSIVGGTARYNYVHASIYSGVDQGTVFNGTAQQNSGATAASPTFSPALTIATGEQAIEVYNTTRVGGTPSRTMTTPAAGWSSAITATAW
ncbi:MAG: hypothetical protein Q7V04_02825, partial [Deltaproteobacteria bacterium]|nr:hypothetical protein [Deltaproteobacteria bacterium]